MQWQSNVDNYKATVHYIIIINCSAESAELEARGCTNLEGPLEILPGPSHDDESNGCEEDLQPLGEAGKCDEILDVAGYDEQQRHHCLQQQQQQQQS